jgi:hypothetical protein
MLTKTSEVLIFNCFVQLDPNGILLNIHQFLIMLREMLWNYNLLIRLLDYEKHNI